MTTQPHKVLAIEMYKIANGSSPNFMIDLMTDLGNHNQLGGIAMLLLTKKRT